MQWKDAMVRCLWCQKIFHRSRIIYRRFQLKHYRASRRLVGLSMVVIPVGMHEIGARHFCPYCKRDELSDDKTHPASP